MGFKNSCPGCLTSLLGLPHSDSAPYQIFLKAGTLAQGLGNEAFRGIALVVFLLARFGLGRLQIGQPGDASLVLRQQGRGKRTTCLEKKKVLRRRLRKPKNTWKTFKQPSCYCQTKECASPCTPLESPPGVLCVPNSAGLGGVQLSEVESRQFADGTISKALLLRVLCWRICLLDLAAVPLALFVRCDVFDSQGLRRWSALLAGAKKKGA